MKEKLREHAVQAFESMIKYMEVIMDSFPDDKMEVRIGRALSPLELLQHIGGTAGWWMKRTQQPFDFSSRLYSREEFFEIINKQLVAFKELLKDEHKLYWKSNDDEKPKFSVPWIMIRTVNHALHHGAMLVHYRHIYELPPMKFPDGMDWGNIVDIAGDLFYSDL